MMPVRSQGLDAMIVAIVDDGCESGLPAIRAGSKRGCGAWRAGK
jgi:hypothetical protein